MSETAPPIKGRVCSLCGLPEEFEEDPLLTLGVRVHHHCLVLFLYNLPPELAAKLAETTGLEEY